jgi:hypothetical protein
MSAHTAHCPHHRAPTRAHSAQDRRRQTRALGALAVMGIVVGQLILACHDGAHAAGRGTLAAGADPIAALIAAARCSTLASPPGMAPPVDDSGDTPNSGCLHCAGGRCQGAARHTTAGTWATFVALDLAALLPWNVRNNGAMAWQTGHPVRGPPLWGL